MKEVFEHEGNKYILVEGTGNENTTCKGCSFRDEKKEGCIRGSLFPEHNCSDRTDIFVLLLTPGPKKKLEL